MPGANVLSFRNYENERRAFAQGTESPMQVRRSGSAAGSILCIGEDERLLSTRCAVLMSRGYDATFETVQDVQQQLPNRSIDLVVFSACVEKKEIETVHSALPAGTKMLAIEGMLMPEQLLTLVEVLLR
jgi:hypothetical protein